MKKILLPMTACLLLFSCADKKAQEKALLDSVITMHEKVMNEDGKVTDYQGALDTFVKKNTKGTLVDSANFYLQKLALADTAMMVWMHGFSPELKKSHDENLSYLHQQQKLILHIDSQMNAVITPSGKFITKTKIK